jgi:hypothetical protein
MKKLLFATVALGALISAPAMACPMMQQTAAAGSTGTQTTQAGGMICSRPTAMQAQAQPEMSQPGQQAQSSGGCSCCRNMAMMQPPAQSGQSPSMPNMGNMPGMQPNTPQPTPAPEQPKPQP